MNDDSWGQRTLKDVQLFEVKNVQRDKAIYIQSGRIFLPVTKEEAQKEIEDKTRTK